MLIGKEVTHEYRGRGTVIAVGEGEIVVRFGKIGRASCRERV